MKITVKSLGCLEQCPYCGSKCREIMTSHDKHTTDRHNLMAFRGCYEFIEEGKKGFVFDMCNSDKNIQQSQWSSSVNASKIKTIDDIEILEKITKHSLTKSNVTFTLSWHDRNDLDLYVVCPCNTTIYYGNRNCDICRGILEKDMNRCCHDSYCIECSDDPVEHIHFKTPRYGEYKCYVWCYNSEPKKNASYISSFKVGIQADGNNIIKNQINLKTDRRIDIGNFNFSESLNFIQHVEKYYKSWSGIKPADRSEEWENLLKSAWKKISKKMAEKYRYRIIQYFKFEYYKG